VAEPVVLAPERAAGAEVTLGQRRELGLLRRQVSAGDPAEDDHGDEPPLDVELRERAGVGREVDAGDQHEE
jgi:hypothetical protein